MTEFEVAAGEGVGGVSDRRAAAAEEDRSAFQEKNDHRHPRLRRRGSVVVVVFHFGLFWLKSVLQGSSVAPLYSETSSSAGLFYPIVRWHVAYLKPDLLGLQAFYFNTKIQKVFAYLIPTYYILILLLLFLKIVKKVVRKKKY